MIALLSNRTMTEGGNDMGALDVPCPKCKAEVGETCVFLSDIGGFSKGTPRSPHDVRTAKSKEARNG